MAEIRFSFEKTALVPAGTVGWRGTRLEAVIPVRDHENSQEKEVVEPAS